jgi:hypothetical protein
MSKIILFRKEGRKKAPFLTKKLNKKPSNTNQKRKRKGKRKLPPYPLQKPKQKKKSPTSPSPLLSLVNRMGGKGPRGRGNRLFGHFYVVLGGSFEWKISFYVSALTSHRPPVSFFLLPPIPPYPIFFSKRNLLVSLQGPKMSKLNYTSFLF